MKRFPFILILALFLAFCAAPVVAQTNATYRFDNFDTANGVHVQTPPVKARLQPKTVRPTSKAISSLIKTQLRSVPALYTVSGLAMSSSKSLDGFTTGNDKVDTLIVQSGVRNGVDPVLLYAIMHQESTFKQHAVSPKGARGLMQLMPGTAARFGVSNIFDPRQNIEAGARYVRFLLEMFKGNVSLALAGYNAGEGAVLKYGRIPPYSETQEYVRRIAGRYALMRNPETARRAQPLTSSQVAVVRASQQSAPLTVYERNVFAVRLPGGRLQLVSQ